MRFVRFAWCLAPLFAAGTCFAQTSPVPSISQPLVPAAVEPAGPGFSLTVNGAGFVSGSIVNWNGTPLATTYVSAAKLKAVVPATIVSTNGTARVTVVSPGPGGGSSDPALFTITEPTSSPVFNTLPLDGLTSPINVVTADFNNDGIPDLAVIDQAPAPSCHYQFGAVGSIAILLGNGDGTFAKGSALCYFDDLLGERPERFAVSSDLNRDGNVDLIGISEFQGEAILDVAYGNGDGTFGHLGGGVAAVTFKGLSLGDFYSNGQLNIAISEVDDYDFSDIYLLPEYDYLLFNPYVLSAGSLVSGDFNGDGVLDLADNYGSLTIFLNRGNGVFTQMPAIPFDHAGEPNAEPPIVAGDFNGDGILDLATVDGNSISVLLGKGDGTFSEKTGQPVSAETNVSLITADMNGDGKLDLVVIDSTNTVSIWLGNGDGTFQAPLDTTGRGDSVVAADFNGDGRMDLAVMNSADGTASILLQGSPYKTFVESPIDAGGTSVFSAKRGDLPVKFSLAINDVLTCNLPPATIAITRSAGGALGLVNGSAYVTPADKGSSFRIDRSACQYVYNLDARSLGIGTYRVDVGINGTVAGYAVFALQ